MGAGASWAPVGVKVALLCASVLLNLTQNSRHHWAKCYPRVQRKYLQKVQVKWKQDWSLGYKCDALLGLEISWSRVTAMSWWSLNPLLRGNHIPPLRDWFNIKAAGLPLSDLCFYMNFRLTDFFFFSQSKYVFPYAGKRETGKWLNTGLCAHKETQNLRSAKEGMQKPASMHLLKPSLHKGERTDFL